jgi:hypothetical protein
MTRDPAGADEAEAGTSPRYLPVAEHGLIGDLHTVALVGTNGTIDWYCCPAFDSPSVFGALLDADRGGSFELAPASPARARQFYVPDTNVLLTRFYTGDAVGEVQDFMPLRPGTGAADHRLVRRVLCVRGTMTFRARVSPRFDYGRQTHTVEEYGGGVLFHSADLRLSLTATVPLRCDGRDVEAEFTLGEGESAVFAVDTVRGGAELRGCSGTEAENSSTPPSGTGAAGCRRRATAAGGARWCTARRSP